MLPRPDQRYVLVTSFTCHRKITEFLNIAMLTYMLRLVGLCSRWACSRRPGKQELQMRRIAPTLAVAGALLGMGLVALPAAASTTGIGAVTRTTSAAQASPTPAQRQAAARAARLAALRNQRGIITGILRSSSGAPEAGVCVVATGTLVTRKAFTQPDGRYMITGLPRGAYRVEYRGCSPIGRFTGQWYGGLTRTSAARVNVTGAAPTELAPVTLGMISPRFDRAPSPRQPGPASQAGALVSRLVSGQ